MPLLCMLMLAVVQLAVVLRDQLAVIEAARVAARAAAVASDPGGAAVAAASRLLDGRARVTTTDDGEQVTVSVALLNPTDVPLVGFVLPDIEVRGRSSMLLEPP
jgi:hypothetical protein